MTAIQLSAVLRDLCDPVAFIREVDGEEAAERFLELLTSAVVAYHGNREEVLAAREGAFQLRVYEFLKAR